MTISTEVRKAGPFIGNDSASVFPFAFKVFKAADLIVVRRQDNIGEETTLILDSDYHVTLSSNQDTTPGGVVTLVAGALASGFTLVVSSELPYLQPTDLTNQGGFYPKVITNALDRLTIFCQQLAEITGRTLKLPITAPANISTEIPLPNPAELIAWNETGTGLTTVSPQSLVTSIAYGSATADLFAGDGVTTTFPLSTNPASVNNLDVSVGGFSQRPVQGGVGDYSWNGGASITFVTPPPAPTVPGDKNVLVRYMQAIPVSDSEALHAQTREALRRGYAEAGYNLVDGSFETGGTLASTTDVLLLESTGAAYAWTGAYPVGVYDVAPGVDPTVVVGFELRKNVLLRDNCTLAFDTVSDMKANSTLKVGQIVSTRGFYSANDGGGARFRVVQSVLGGATGFGSHDLQNGLVAVHVVQNGTMNVLEYGIQPGVATAGVQEAINAFTVRTLKFNSGVYQLENVTLRSYLTIQGESRDTSILQTKTGSLGFLMGIVRTSANPDNNVKDVTLNDVHLKGNLLDGAPFDEHQHCFHASGFTGLYFNRCKVSEFIGDGIYLGAGTSSYQETYNYNFVANDLIIDGINRENRNGISIITIDGFYLKNFRILNTARSDMPGAIDFEPNGHNWYKIANVHIEDGVVSDCRGGIIFHNGNDSLPATRDVTIENVRFNGCEGPDIAFIRSRAINTQFTQSQNLNVTWCSGEGGVNPLYIVGVVGVNVHSCNWKSYTSSNIIGPSSSSGEPTLDPQCNVYHVQIDGCSFNSVGTGSNFMEIGNVSNLSFVRNAVINCSNESTGRLFNFLANKSTANIKINDNFFYKNVGLARGGLIAYHNAGHTTTENANTFLRNSFDMPDISSKFKAFRTDVVPSDANRFSGASSPSVFKNGVSVTRVMSAAGLPAGKTNGHLSVVKNQLTTGEVDLSVRMEFVEDTTGEIWSKTATSDTTWSAWRQIC